MADQTGDNAPHNPFLPDEADPAHPSEEGLKSHSSASPVPSEGITINPDGGPLPNMRPVPPPPPIPPVPPRPEPPAEEGEVSEVVESPTQKIDSTPTVPPPPPFESQPANAATPALPSVSPEDDALKKLNQPAAGQPPVPEELDAAAFARTASGPPPEDEDKGSDTLSRVLASIALALALLALLTLIGVLPIGKVGTSDIQDSAVTNSKLATGSVSEDKLQAGTIREGPVGPAGADGADGARGPIGKTGPTGKAGKNGSKGKPGITNLVSINRTTPADSTHTHSLTVQCPGDTQLLYAGASVSGDPSTLNKIALQSSAPLDSAGSGWAADAIETKKTNGSWSLSITGTCAKFGQKTIAAK